MTVAPRRFTLRVRVPKLNRYFRGVTSQGIVKVRQLHVEKKGAARGFRFPT